MTIYRVEFVRLPEILYGAQLQFDGKEVRKSACDGVGFFSNAFNGDCIEIEYENGIMREIKTEIKIRTVKYRKDENYGTWSVSNNTVEYFMSKPYDNKKLVLICGYDYKYIEICGENFDLFKEEMRPLNKIFDVNPGYYIEPYTVFRYTNVVTKSFSKEIVDLFKSYVLFECKKKNSCLDIKVVQSVFNI